MQGVGFRAGARGCSVVGIASVLFLFQGVLMKKLIPFIAIATMAFTGLSAQAQVVQQKAASGVAKAEGALDKGLASQGLKNQGLYGELGLSLLSYKISNHGISAKPIMLRGIVGYDYHPNLAAEAMLGLGLRGGSATGYFGSAYNVSAGTMIGVYAKPRLQLGDMELFGRLGLVNTSSSVRGYTGTDGGAGLSYGAGFSYLTDWASFSNRKISINADYMSYYSGSGVKYTGFTLGAGMKF
jgi:hypothetical protein